MVTLKSVIPLILGDVESVIVAATTCPELSETPSLSQTTVIGPFALAGLQPDVAILNVIGVFPVFLT
jgi:hypothetical protein